MPPLSNLIKPKTHDDLKRSEPFLNTTFLASLTKEITVGFGALTLPFDLS